MRPAVRQSNKLLNAQLFLVDFVTMLSCETAKAQQAAYCHCVAKYFKNVVVWKCCLFSVVLNCPHARLLKENI